MSETIPLKPGTYRLVRDVENPRPDRRYTSDWRHFPVWKEGEEFLVTEHKRDLDIEGLTAEQRAVIEARSYYVTIAKVGYRWKHNSVGPGHEDWFKALTDNLEPCIESDEAFFTRLGLSTYDGGYFVRWLVETGRLSHVQMEALWEQYQADPELDSAELPFDRPRFVIADIDREIDRSLLETLSRLAAATKAKP